LSDITEVKLVTLVTYGSTEAAHMQWLKSTYFEIQDGGYLLIFNH